MSIGNNLKEHVKDLGVRYVDKQKRKIDDITAKPLSEYSTLQYRLDQIKGEISVQEADAKVEISEAKEEYIEKVEEQYTPEQLETGARNLVNMQESISELDKEGQESIENFLDNGTRIVANTVINVGDAGDFKAAFEDVFEPREFDQLAKFAVVEAKA